MNRMKREIAREKVAERTRLETVTSEIKSGQRPAGVCDKCGRTVPYENNATVFDFKAGNIFAMFCTPRHFLPVVENGVMVCEGSPSRAQYIEGQPRDKRISYQYKPEREAPFRAIYAEMQHEAAAQVAHLN